MIKKTVLPLLLLSSVSFAAAPDNTKINQRDSKKSELTAQEQMNGSDTDVEITRKIRSSLMKDKSLSTYAQNVKIITLKGNVTIKGPVKGASEKEKVESYASNFVTRDHIHNELDIIIEK